MSIRSLVFAFVILCSPLSTAAGDVAYSSFGPFDSYLTTGGYFFGNWYSFQRRHEAFQFVSGATGVFESIEVAVAVGHFGDYDRAVFNLWTDEKGLPGSLLWTGDAIVLEQMIVEIPADSTTILNAGTAYWLSATNESGWAGYILWHNDQGIVTLETRDLEGGTDWSETTNVLTPAYRINVSAIQPIVPDALTVFRGVQIGGTLEDVFESDDSRIRFNPGLTINSSEDPVWLIFDGTLPGDNPGSLQIVMESQAGTPGLTHTLEAWNWTSAAHDVVDVSPASFNDDVVVTVDLSSAISDYAQAGTGAVRTRVGWRKTGLIIDHPWEVRLDQLVWIVTN